MTFKFCLDLTFNFLKLLSSCFLNGLFPRLFLIVGRVEVNSVHWRLENNLKDKKNGARPSLNSPEPLFNFIVLKLDLSTFLSVEFFKDIPIMEKFSPGRQSFADREITLSMSLD